MNGQVNDVFSAFLSAKEKCKISINELDVKFPSIYPFILNNILYGYLKDEKDTDYSSLRWFTIMFITSNYLGENISSDMLPTKTETKATKATSGLVELNEYYKDEMNQNITKLCFDIYVKKKYLFLTEVRVIACRFNENFESKFGFGIGKDPHIQTITLYDVDIAAIMKYISDMEHEIDQENFQKTNFLAVNEYRCKDCQRKIVNNR